MLTRHWLDRLVRSVGIQSVNQRDEQVVRRTSGVRYSCPKKRRQAGCLSHLSSESLEVRQVMSASPIAGLSDEFNDAASINQWSEVNQVEGWGARGAQLNQWTVNAGGDGRMVMQPHTVVWYEDWRGPLVFKEITGDFVVTTRMQISDRDNVGGADADNVPGDGQFSLGGLMIRTPRAITNGAADWVPGSRNDVGNVGENYVFLSMGYSIGANNFSFEVKTTRNSTSTLELTPLGLNPNEVELRIARIGSAIITLHRLAGQTDWTVHRRYSRPDMPQTMQVGMVTYSDWEKANDLAPIVHNGSVIAPGQIADPSPGVPFNPDLTASFDYTRFARPQVPAELAGVNLVTGASNAQLLSFLGANVLTEAPPQQLPTVTIDATDANAAEAGQDPAVFTVTRTGNTSADLIVNYTVGGTAMSSSDYTALTGSVLIPAGQTSASVTVTPINDSAVESNETVTLTIANHASYIIGSANSDSATLVSDDVASGNDLAALSDEFTNAASINDWSEVNHVEGWGARGAQLNQWTVNAGGDGRMVMQPHSVVWYEDWRGPLVFKEVTGNFVVTTKMRVTDRDNIGGSDADDVPGDGQFSLGGLMIRTPRAISNGAADWVAGTRNDVGNVGENYVFMSMGYATGTNRYSFEVKTTRNSTSNLELTPLGLTPNEVELRIARIGSTVIVLHRLDGEANWTVHRRYSRPDMPQTLQVGMVTYSDWEKANDLTPVVHNGAIIAPGQISDPTPFQPFNPDLTASFDYTRFDRPQVPAELAGVNLLTATDNQLLSFLGQGGDANPEPPKETRIGMNVSGLADWDPSWLFRDAFKRARPWGAEAINVATGETGWQFYTGDGPQLAVNDQGWVTSLPQWQHSNGTIYQQRATTVVFTDESRQPAGIYRAEWEGNGDLVMPFVTESGTMPDGRHYALVDMPFGVHFPVFINSTDPANPIRNIHLWMPDYNGQSLVGEWQPGDSGSPFHPLMVDRLDEFDTLRFMDLMNTNASVIATWDDRAFVDDASQADGELYYYADPGRHNHGLAPEYLIELSNETGANPWFNMPHLADDNYVRQFATLVRNTLDPDLKVYVEWSNEIWNGIFPTYHWLAAQTQLPENAGLDFFAIAGREMRRDFDIWSDVFAGQEDRLVRVVAGQQANVWLTEQFLANVAGRVDAVSATAYAGIGPEIFANLDPVTTTPDDIIDSILNVSIPWASARLREHESLIETYEAQLGRDLQFVTYESGAHVMSAPNPFFGTELADEAFAAQSSPRMYDVYQSLLGVVNDAGVDLYNEFSFTSHSSSRPYGSFGVLNDMTTPLSDAHKLRSLYDYIAANAPANARPVLGTLADRTVSEGELLSFTVTATDPDGDALTFRLREGSPAGATIDPQSGVFSWTPNASQGGSFFDIFVEVEANGQTDTGLFRVTVNDVPVNSAPVLNAIADQSINEGSTLNFIVSATDADAGQTLTYSLGDDAPTGMTINAQTGAVSWTPSDAESDDVYLVTIIATDNGSPALFDETTVAITVSNIAPTASISGPTEVIRGQAAQFTLSANDPSATDQAAGFTFDIDWNGDGTVDQTVVGPSGTVVSHVYSVATTFNIIVTATDKDEAISTPAQTSVNVINTGLITDPIDSSRTALLILGSGGNDLIQVLTTSIAGRVQVKQNNRVVGTFAPTGRIIINGYAGNDTILLDSRITLPAELDGGAGNDTLTGAGGNDIILGGAGDDSLNGSGGRDVIVGGTGRDRINGGSGEDILIGGTTSHAITAIRQVMAEWSSARTYAARIANITGVGSGTRSNGTTYLQPNATVSDDTATDQIWGAGHADWLFARLDGTTPDVLNDRISSETVTRI